MNPLTSPLLTDLYQLNMIQAYLDHGETKTAVFEFFVRKFPLRRGFLVAAGLQQVLDFLENLRFSPEEIGWLAHTHRFDKGLLDRLASFRFTGDVHAMPEGRVFFADEPPPATIARTDSRAIRLFHLAALNRGLFIAPRGLVALSTVISDELMAEICGRASDAISDVAAESQG